MDYVSTIPASEVNIGTVFYAEGYGYVVVVLMVGDRLVKAYTSYGRPMVLLKESSEEEYKVYPQLGKAEGKEVRETVQVDNEDIGEVRLNAKGIEVVITPEGEYVGTLVSDGDSEVILKDNVVVYKDVVRVGNVELGERCEKIEYKETGKALNIKVVDDWREQLGEDAGVTLGDILVEVLNRTLHTSQLSREDRKWAKEVIAFRDKQKPIRVNGKLFKPRASRFVSGFIRDGVLNLYFIKKITDVVYRVTLNTADPEAKYVIEECDDDLLRGEIQRAVMDKLIPLATYDYLFGKRSLRTTQVSGQIPIELHERIKWGGYTLPQVIAAGIQALEDGDSRVNFDEIPNIIEGYTERESMRELLRAVLLGEDFD